MKLELTRRRKIILGAAVSLLLLWLFWPDRSLAKVRALRDELGQAQTPEEREAKGRELRDAMQKLKPEQREQLFAEGRKRGNEEMERYHQLSPQEKKKYLDQQINRQEQMRQRFQQQAGQPNGSGRPMGFGSGGPGGPSNRPNTPDDRERRRQQMLDNSTPRERELRDLFRRDMDQRRRERGLPPSPPGRGGR